MAWSVIQSSEVDPKDIAVRGSGIIHVVHLKIDNIEELALNLIGEIGNTSWVSQLHIFAQAAYETTVRQTAEKLVEIFKRVTCDITTEFGEYAVSLSASQVLGVHYKHTRIPISELWKTQKSQNPGFDFHTISQGDYIIFGEAKYNSRDNAYPAAAEQVVRFLNDNKHKNDILDLKEFAPIHIIEKLIKDEKGVALAFSINSPDVAKILTNALRNKDVIDIIGRTSELYMIGVEI